MNNKKVNFAWNLLKITYGLLFIIAGADKFFNLITNWSKYVSPIVLDIVPIDLKTLIIIVGLFEIALGILILMPRWTRIASFVASIWLITIALNLLSLKIYFDIAVRDTVMAIGAMVLSILTKAVENKD